MEEAITALVLRSHGHPEHSSSLSNLAKAVSTRFEQLERMEDLEEASNVTVKHFLSDSWPPDYSLCLNDLANAMSTRFRQLERMEGLEEAITCLRQALALFPHGHPNRSLFLNI